MPAATPVFIWSNVSMGVLIDTASVVWCSRGPDLHWLRITFFAKRLLGRRAASPSHLRKTCLHFISSEKKKVGGGEGEGEKSEHFFFLKIFF